MKICILSDSHDNIPLLKAAVQDAKEHGAEAIIHCGDVVAPSTLATLQRYELPIHAIHGNNSGDLYSLSRLAHKSKNLIEYYGQDADFQLGGRRIFLVHYPHYARALAMTGDYDLVCCGHTHKVQIERIPNMRQGETLLLNPGTVAGIGSAPATYILGDLNTLEFIVMPVPEMSANTDDAQKNTQMPQLSPS
jgi:uncharacterized protein